MDITGIRDKNTTPEGLRDYRISDLIDKVDCILSEHGFLGGKKRVDNKIGNNYIVYEGMDGWVVVRFSKDESELIPLIVENKVVARCPVYAELRRVPENITDSIKRDLREI